MTAILLSRGTAARYREALSAEGALQGEQAVLQDRLAEKEQELASFRDQRAGGLVELLLALDDHDHR